MIDLYAPRGSGECIPPIVDLIEVNADCWEWKGTIATNGYGHIEYDGVARLAHRFIYEALVGPIKEGLTLDHLCRVRRCVNPDHLDPVAIGENIRRGQVRHVCRHGHRRFPWRTGVRSECLDCANDRSKARNRPELRAIDPDLTILDLTDVEEGS